MDTALFLKEFEQNLKTAIEKLSETLRAIRGSRPTVGLVSDIKVNYFDQWLSVKQLGSLSVFPPRGIQVVVWDKNAVGAVAKAIENAKVGLTVTTDGGTVRAMLSPLGNERREELCRLVKKETEGARIRVRAGRDEAIKKLKTAEDGGGLSEDSLFKTKEKVQKLVDEANARIETALSEKIKELGE